MDRKEIFARFLKPELLAVQSKNPSFWSRETKILNKLVSVYSEEFLSKYYLTFKLNSFAFFNTENGKQVIKDDYAKYSYNKSLKAEAQTEYKISEEKTGEDIVRKRKPKTIFDI